MEFKRTSVDFGGCEQFFNSKAFKDYVSHCFRMMPEECRKGFCYSIKAELFKQKNGKSKRLDPHQDGNYTNPGFSNGRFNADKLLAFLILSKRGFKGGEMFLQWNTLEERNEACLNPDFSNGFIYYSKSEERNLVTLNRESGDGYLAWQDKMVKLKGVGKVFAAHGCEGYEKVAADGEMVFLRLSFKECGPNFHYENTETAQVEVSPMAEIRAKSGDEAIEETFALKDLITLPHSEFYNHPVAKFLTSPGIAELPDDESWEKEMKQYEEELKKHV